MTSKKIVFKASSTSKWKNKILNKIDLYLCPAVDFDRLMIFIIFLCPLLNSTNII